MMKNKNTIKKLIACFILAVWILIPMASFAVSAAGETVDALTPHRTEYGNTVGDLITLADGKTVCQNYEYGYVYAELTKDGRYSNKRDVGGMNIDANGEVDTAQIVMQIPGDENGNAAEAVEQDDPAPDVPVSSAPVVTERLD